MIIQPQTKTVEDILQGPGFYRIPRFQRPFSWTVDHIDEFWDDAVENRDAGYFIGPMVVYKDGQAEWGIVDGQQRLTTITLILAVIRDRLDAFAERDLADGVHGFIERTDRDRKKRFIIQSDVDEGSWIQNVQLRTPVKPTRLGRGSDPTQRAYDLVNERLSTVIDAELAKKPKKTADQRAVELLRAIRDQVLSLAVIWVPLDLEDDAYVIFETLNSRGKDLELADLVKNFFLSHIRAANANVDDCRSRWSVIRDSYAAEQGADINRFILHWWLSQQPYVAERKVFKEIKRKIKRPQVEDTFDAFEEDADRYLTIIQPGRVHWTIERLPLRDSLLALRIMRLAQPLPMVLSLLRAYDAKRLTPKQVVQTLAVIERYHFQVTAISARSSSGGVSEMYATHARRLTEATTPATRRACIDQLAEKLRARKPDRDDFLESFESRLVFTDDHARDKQLVQYVLQRIHRHERPAPPVDFSRFTIEHVLPQSTITTEQDVPVVGGIGNLLLLHEDLNAKLDNKTFVQKKKILAPHRKSYEIEDVLSSTNWAADEIAARTRRLGGLAYDAVWAL
jgi:hypothetical protein